MEIKMLMVLALDPELMLKWFWKPGRDGMTDDAP
jgi:hypothetical protein